MKSGGDNTIFKGVQSKICGSETGDCAQAIQDKAKDTCGTNDSCISDFSPQVADSIWGKVVGDPTNVNLSEEKRRKVFVKSLNNEAYAKQWGRGDAHSAMKDLKEKYKDKRENPPPPPTSTNNNEGPYFSISNRFTPGQNVGIGAESLKVETEGYTFKEPHDNFGLPWLVLEAGYKWDGLVAGLFYEHALGRSGLIDETGDVDVPNLQALGLFAQYNFPVHEYFEPFVRVGLGGLFTDGVIKKSGELPSAEIDFAGGVLYMPMTVGAKVYLVKSNSLNLSLMLEGGVLLSYSREDTTIDPEVEAGSRAPYDILRTESGFAPPFTLRTGLGFEF